MKQSSTSSACGEMAEIHFLLNKGKTWNYHIALTQEGSTATSAATITSLPSRELLSKMVATQHTDWLAKGSFGSSYKTTPGFTSGQIAGRSAGAGYKTNPELFCESPD